MASIDLESVIEDSITDSQLSEDPIESTPSDSVESEEASSDTPTEATSGLGVVGSTETEETPTTSDEPVVDPTKPVVDDFDKKFGLQKEAFPGKENRIPYSRVRKIVEKAVKDAETGYTPKLKEFEAKVQDYEGRLTKVAQFEKIMVEEPDRFMTMLMSLPQYQTYFAQRNAAPIEPSVQSVPDQSTPQVDDDPMPEPDKELADGSRVYSLEGFKAREEWNRRQARKEVMAEVQKTFGPIKQSYEEHIQERQRQEYYSNVIIPQITAQINQARQWPLFNENEAEITKALDKDKSLSLEGAYRQVVLPKLVSSRDQMRQDVIKELKKVPSSTAVPSGGVKPNPVTSRPAGAGPRDLEEVIREKVEELGVAR